MAYEQIQHLLKRYHLKANHTLGQHFLLDDGVLGQMIEAAQVGPEDTILEVGPGVGNLTKRLAETGARVIAVEKDTSFESLLNNLADEHPNIELHFGDVLEMDVDKVVSPGASGYGYKVVANLPYYLTGIFMQRILRQPRRPKNITVLIQREVAENMSAKPGHMNLLALSVQLVGIPRIVAYVPAESFYPSPKVESAVVTVDIPDTPLYAHVDERQLFRVTKACFAGKRKQIHNTLTHNLGMDKVTVEKVLIRLGLESSVRPQALSVEQFVALSQAFAEMG